MISIRLFVAVELPEDLRTSIAGLSRFFSHADIKPVKKENIHLTLKFLGEVEDKRTAEVVNALQQPGTAVSSFSLTPGTPGAFPNPSRARVLWVGLAGVVPPLIELQQLVEQALKPLGFEPEKRPYAPHITFARLRKPADVTRQLERARASFGYNSQVKVDSYVLYQSILHRSGPEYRIVKRFGLK